MSIAKKILLVDDDEVSNLYTEFVITKFNPALSVRVCINGEEAVEFINSVENLPDLIMLDINMPLMNGFEFLDWYEKKSLTHKPKISMYSTSNRLEDINQAMAYEDVFFYIQKPLNAEKLQEMFEEMKSVKGS